jgi:hypothetical protein
MYRDIWAFVCGVINMAITRGFGGNISKFSVRTRSSNWVQENGVVGRFKEHNNTLYTSNLGIEKSDEAKKKKKRKRKSWINFRV